MQNRINYLLNQYRQHKASQQELKELYDLLNTSDTQQHFNAWMSTENNELMQPLSNAKVDEIVRSIINTAPHVKDSSNYPPMHRVHFLKTAWFRWAAAVIIITGIGLYFLLNKQNEKPLVAKVEPVLQQNEILPGSQKAILTLSNGKQIELNSTATETITDQKLTIENKNGQLIYAVGDVVAMNTMSTPAGGQYQLTLSDGTRVWLNAASSISYPTSFVNKMREVSITGEAYFEVKANAAKPFVVKTDRDKITVLGTSFNVNAYKDEQYVKTSLLEGAIHVNEMNIKPGQAYQNKNVVITDVQQDIAWKNGVFNFSGQDLKMVMRQIERWYNVTVKYEGELSDFNIGGKMDRGAKLSGIIRFLEQNGLKVRMNDKLLILSQ
jgi:transmembrane sensor